MFTSNVTGVEVPNGNIIEAYKYIKEWKPSKQRITKWKEWPWRVSHPNY